MDDNSKLLETLLDRATEYGKTSYELVKLKAVDKTSDVISSSVPGTVVVVLIASFMIFLNLGLAFWIGEILGKTFYGFFIVASFYLLLAVIIYLFMYKWLKKIVCNYLIRKLLK
jgi:hypothetical protein